jgi:hypothetical protein
MPSKSAAFTSREDVGCGVIVGVGVDVAGMLVDVGLFSGVALARVAVGEGGALQAVTRKMPNRSENSTSMREKIEGVSIPSAV